MGSGRRKWGEETNNFLSINTVFFYSSSNNDDDDNYVILNDVYSSCIEMHFGFCFCKQMLKLNGAFNEKLKKKKEVWKLTLETQRRASKIKCKNKKIIMFKKPFCYFTFNKGGKLLFFQSDGFFQSLSSFMISTIRQQISLLSFSWFFFLYFILLTWSLCSKSSHNCVGVQLHPFYDRLVGFFPPYALFRTFSVALLSIRN